MLKPCLASSFRAVLIALHFVHLYKMGLQSIRRSWFNGLAFRDGRHGNASFQ